MVGTPLDQLTDPQRQCLRLVLTHHNSKEIAALLGVSPSAVDKRIERAVQVLGVATRFAAARMLATHEGHPTSERLPSDPIDVSPTPSVEAAGPRDEPRGLVRRLLGIEPLAGWGGEARNTLSWPKRLGVVAALTIVIAVVTMALLNMGQTVSTIALQHSGPPSR